MLLHVSLGHLYLKVPSASVAAFAGYFIRAFSGFCLIPCKGYDLFYDLSSFLCLHIFQYFI